MVTLMVSLMVSLPIFLLHGAVQATSPEMEAVHKALDLAGIANPTSHVCQRVGSVNAPRTNGQDPQAWLGIECPSDGLTIEHLRFYWYLTLTELPPAFFTELAKITTLETLYFDISGLQSLPEELGSITSLKRLVVNIAPVASVPDSIGALTSLERLSIIATSITSFPASLASLTSLKELNVWSNTDLTSFPNVLGSFASLEKVLIHDNALECVPELPQGKGPFVSDDVSNFRADQSAIDGGVCGALSYELVGNGWCTNGGSRVGIRKMWYTTTVRSDNGADLCEEECSADNDCIGYQTEDGRKCQLMSGSQWGSPFTSIDGVDGERRNYCWRRVRSDRTCTDLLGKFWPTSVQNWWRASANHWHVSTDGGVVSPRSISGPEDCRAWCHSEPECTASFFRGSGNHCSLYRDGQAFWYNANGDSSSAYCT